jgi:hypothetical protein
MSFTTKNNGRRAGWWVKIYNSSIYHSMLLHLMLKLHRISWATISLTLHYSTVWKKTSEGWICISNLAALLVLISMWTSLHFHFIHYRGTFKVLVCKIFKIYQLHNFDKAFENKFATFAQFPQKQWNSFKSTFLRFWSGKILGFMWIILDQNLKQSFWKLLWNILQKSMIFSQLLCNSFTGQQNNLVSERKHLQQSVAPMFESDSIRNSTQDTKLTPSSPVSCPNPTWSLTCLKSIISSPPKKHFLPKFAIPVCIPWFL